MTLQGHPRSLILAPIESAYVRDFLLVLNSNFGPILLRFRDIRAFVCQKQVRALWKRLLWLPVLWGLGSL